MATTPALPSKPSLPITAAYKAATPNLLGTIPLSTEQLKISEMGPNRAMDIFYNIMKAILIVSSTPTRDTSPTSNQESAVYMAADALDALSQFSDNHFDYFLRDERFFFALNTISDQILFKLQKLHRSELIQFLRSTFEACARPETTENIPSSRTRLGVSQSAKNLNDFLSRLNPEMGGQFRDFYRSVYRPQEPTI
ncbi:MAG: hypothetical protein IPJ69_07420 [Deltaproteobacteria bacterium]|nr:MAG: hypothetical protein IPJ69_07420 [Deltaproteobacteria bacterium]